MNSFASQKNNLVFDVENTQSLRVLNWLDLAFNQVNLAKELVIRAECLLNENLTDFSHNFALFFTLANQMDVILFAIH